MIADINSGSIFSLLLPNVLFVACTMYNTENVNILFWKCGHFIFDVFIMLVILFFKVIHWRGYADWFSCALCYLFFNLAIFVLLFCYICYISSCSYCTSCLRFELVGFASEATEVYYFDYRSFTRNNSFYWIWSIFLHIGSSWKSLNSLFFIMKMLLNCFFFFLALQSLLFLLFDIQTLYTTSTGLTNFKTTLEYVSYDTNIEFIIIFYELNPKFNLVFPSKK